jgi:hypothetical protein
MSNKCIVFKCTNYKHQGNFVGDICAPCYETITTGKLIPSNNFISELGGSRDVFMKMSLDFADMNFEMNTLIQDMRIELERFVKQQPIIEQLKTELQKYVLNDIENKGALN